MIIYTIPEKLKMYHPEWISESKIPNSENISFRVLILDDEADSSKEIFNPYRALSLLKKEGWQRNIPPFPFEIKEEHQDGFEFWYHPDLQLQIIFCRSILLARDYLYKQHIDICLIDLDFKDDSEYHKKGDELPELGGLLFGMPLLMNNSDYTVVSIFTAKSDRLERDSEQYRYLKDFQDLGNLSFKKIDNNAQDKHIPQQLRANFEIWCLKILKKLRPTANSCLQIANYLGKPDSSKLKSLSLVLRVDRKDLSKSILCKLFDTFLELAEPQDNSFREPSEKRRNAVIREFRKLSCGHALVRYIFCSKWHNEKQRKDAFDNNDGEILSLFADACNLFEIKNGQDLSSQANNSVEEGKYYRTNLVKVLAPIEKDDTSNLSSSQYIFGLSEDPDAYNQALNEEIRKILIHEDRQKSPEEIQNIRKDYALHIYSYELNQQGEKITDTIGILYKSYGRVIKIWGNRKVSFNELEVQVNQGGLGSIKKYLGNRAAELTIEASRQGAYDLLSEYCDEQWQKNQNDPDYKYFSLRIVLYHEPLNTNNRSGEDR